MTTLKFNGPVNLADRDEIRKISVGINGVYVWCVKVNDREYTVYYVGEAKDIRTRLLTHRRCQMGGKYTAHDIDLLKKNELKLTHVARQGMIDSLSHIDRNDYNKSFTEQMWVFYADIESVETSKVDKELRCRYESSLSKLLKDNGNKIVFVGHLRCVLDSESQIRVDSGENVINGLSGQVLCV